MTSLLWPMGVNGSFWKSLLGDTVGTLQYIVITSNTYLTAGGEELTEHAVLGDIPLEHFPPTTFEKMQNYMNSTRPKTATSDLRHLLMPRSGEVFSPQPFSLWISQAGWMPSLIDESFFRDKPHPRQHPTHTVSGWSFISLTRNTWELQLIFQRRHQ